MQNQYGALSDSAIFYYWPQNVSDMGLQAKSVIFVAAVCTMLNIVQSKDNDGDSSDDEDSIREALLLIKLMKKAGNFLFIWLTI